jgi:hypothetical protein
MMKKHDHIKYITLALSHAETPVSWYIINDTNNKLVIQINNFYGSSGTNTTFTLTNGNYNANTFQKMLLNIMGSQWLISISSTTGKFTLSNTSFDFFIRGSLSTCNKLMGFPSNDNNILSTSLSLVMPYPCNFSGTSRVNIKSSTIQTNNLDSVSNGHSSNITSISVSAELYGIILYTNINNFQNIIYNDFLNGIDINLTDENNNPINFNGIDWFITLEINEYLDSTDISNETNLGLFMNKQKNIIS